MEQLHKKFQDHQVKELIQRYLSKEIERSYIQEILGIKKTRFFALVKKYSEDPDSFSIEYERKGATRKISKDIEDSIIKELKIEKQLIEDPEVPLKSYNYSYITVFPRVKNPKILELIILFFHSGFNNNFL